MMTNKNNDRRNFLKTTSATVVGLSALSASANQSNNTSNLSVAGMANVMDYGATGIGSVNNPDDAAIQQAIDENDYIFFPTGTYYLANPLIINRGGVHLAGLGAKSSILKISSDISAIRSTEADRADSGVKSGEDIVIKNIGIIGERVAGSKGIELHRFTRLCKLDGVSVIDTDYGFDISQSWSFVMKRCRAKHCINYGLKAHAPPDPNGPGEFLASINAIDMSGCHFTENKYGVYIQNAQGGHIVGNTSEYNLKYNIQIGGNGLSVLGNYFEGFHQSRTDLGGDDSCVILGTDLKPFYRCLFSGNYINGGSNTSSGFSGDGITLYNVIESEFRANDFSRSTRNPYMVKDSYTVVSNQFDLSRESEFSDSKDIFITNLSTNRKGNVGILSDSHHSNTSTRSNSDSGFEESVRLKPNGTQGSIVENRIYDDGSYDWMFRYGKLSSSSEVYYFTSRQGANYNIDDLTINSKVGFYGASPKTKGTVTGNKAGNSALTSLINELVRLGLISDSTN